MFAANAMSAGPSVATGQAVYTSGTNSWVCPAGVTSVSVVCVGGSGTPNLSGCGGGALAYTNNITVVPGNSYEVKANVYESGRYNSSFNVTSCKAQGGADFVSTSVGGAGGAVIYGTGYPGGKGGNGSGSYVDGWSRAGGGGAGGYAGPGGAGANGNNSTLGTAGTSAPSGGGGGGGSNNGNAGGGVGLLGQGASGAGGTAGIPGIHGGTSGVAGSGGSNRQYGGGSSDNYSTPGGGAVRIIWPGTTRQFPSTNTGDM